MIYNYKLPEPVTGQTHVSVYGEHREGGSVALLGFYGKLSPTGVFTNGSMMQRFSRALSAEEWEDFQEETTKQGRPRASSEHDFRGADVVHWLENEPDAQIRITAKREAARLAAEAAPAPG